MPDLYMFGGGKDDVLIEKRPPGNNLVREKLRLFILPDTSLGMSAPTGLPQKALAEGDVVFFIAISVESIAGCSPGLLLASPGKAFPT